MKSSFSIAVIAGVAVAAPNNSHHKVVPDGKLGNDRPFLNFQSQFNKHYNNENEFVERLERFQGATQLINENNRKATESGNPRALRMKMNFTGDMSEAELESMRGLRNLDESKK